MTIKSKSLQNALNAVDDLPDDWFGMESVGFDDLPSVAYKKEIIRTSTYLMKEDLQYLKEISKMTHVPVAQLTGEIVSKFIEWEKRKKSKI